MAVVCKALLACLSMLALASYIYSQPIIQQVGAPERVVVSPGNRVRLGSGVEPNQLPIYMYSPDATKIDLSVRIRPQKQCNFTFLPHDGVTKVESVKQLGGESKVIFVWSEEQKVGKNSKFSGSSRKSATTISVLDMDTCANTKNLEYAWDVNANGNYIEVVSFINGFDVFISKNDVGSYSSYDIDGNHIGDTITFPVKPTWFSIYPVSQKGRSKGFFVLSDTADEEIKALSLVKADGTIKLLRELSSLEIVSHSGESTYSLCWISDDGLTGDTVVDCAKYDEFGNEQIIAQINRDFDRLVDVKSLKEGDFALFAWNYGGKKLSVVEVRPHQAADSWSYSMDKEFKNAKVVDFDEKDNTFVLAYEDNKIVFGGKGVEESVVLQKFSLRK